MCKKIQKGNKHDSNSSKNQFVSQNKTRFAVEFTFALDNG